MGKSILPGAVRATVWGAGWVVSYIAVWLVSIPITGLLISYLWEWFVAPITGFRGISVSEGFGLTIFFAVAGSIATIHLQKLHWQKLDEKNDAGTKSIATIGLSRMAVIGVLVPLLTLVTSWFWHTFFVSPPSAY